MASDTIKGAGDIYEKAEIASFSTDKYNFSSLPPVFDLRIKNSGNIHIRPKGELTITNKITKNQQNL